MILCEVGAEAKEDKDEEGVDCDHLTFFPVLSEMSAFNEGPASPVMPTTCSSTQNCPDIRLILQELHPGEEVLLCITRGWCWHVWLKTCLNTNTSPPYPVNIHNHNYLM